MATKPHRVTELVSQKRLDDVIRLRLDGAEFWDLREFVREQEAQQGTNWYPTDGAGPLSDSQIRRYQRRADEVIAQSVAGKRSAHVKRHLAQRRHLFAKATTSGDLRTALAVLRDEAELRGLYPEKKTKVSVDGPPFKVYVGFDPDAV